MLQRIQDSRLSRFLPNFARLGSWNVAMFVTVEQVIIQSLSLLEIILYYPIEIILYYPIFLDRQGAARCVSCKQQFPPNPIVVRASAQYFRMLTCQYQEILRGCPDPKFACRSRRRCNQKMTESCFGPLICRSYNF